MKDTRFDTLRTLRSVLLVAAAGVLFSGAAEAQLGGPYQFYAVTPCRVVDTRGDATLSQTPTSNPMIFGTPRSFTIKGYCGVPATARAATLNVTVVGPQKAGFLTIWPAGGAVPIVSTINFNPFEPAIANGAIVPLAVSTPDLSITAGAISAGGTLNVILDVTGYFAP